MSDKWKLVRIENELVEAGSNTFNRVRMTWRNENGHEIRASGKSIRACRRQAKKIIRATKPLDGK